MLLTITSTAPPATDLGFLLHKHPDRLQSFDVSAGQAHVFYPEATEQRCTAALLLEIDPIDLVRGPGRGGNRAAPKSGPDAFSLAQYVNDRPYAASSMLAVALGKVFRTAMNGRCDARPELAARTLPLEITIPALPCRGGPSMAHRFLSPLGWQVSADPIALDPEIPEWGDSRYLSVRLSGTMRLADALNHLYVLLPVLDDAKHYWVDQAEVSKLIRAGGGWLAGHPERDLITHRYLAHQRRLVLTAVGRLAETDDTEPEALDNAVPQDDRRTPADHRQHPARPAGPGGPQSLAQQRRDAVLAVLREAGASTVADLGCGEGALVAALLREPAVQKVIARGRVPAGPRSRRRAAAHRHHAGPPAGPAAAAPVLADLRRQPAHRAGRGGADGGDRAHRAGPARRCGGGRVRLRPSRHGRGHHPERRAQRPLRLARAGRDAAPGPPVRVDPPRVPRLGGQGSGPARLPGRLPAGRRRTTPKSAPLPS